MGFCGLCLVFIFEYAPWINKSGCPWAFVLQTAFLKVYFCCMLVILAYSVEHWFSKFGIWRPTKKNNLQFGVPFRTLTKVLATQKRVATHLLRNTVWRRKIHCKKYHNFGMTTGFLGKDMVGKKKIEQQRIFACKRCS